jgi:hypothetical protein
MSWPAFGASSVAAMSDVAEVAAPLRYFPADGARRAALVGDPGRDDVATRILEEEVARLRFYPVCNDAWAQKQIKPKNKRCHFIVYPHADMNRLSS